MINLGNIIFTLGECSVGGKNYRFDYDNGTYKIYTVNEESEQLLQSIEESKEAYLKWNEIKRPEKVKKV